MLNALRPRRSPEERWMSTPTVDIGIPVYGRAEYVVQAIESVAGQSYPHWRLTISEDAGPTEPILRAVEPYLADQRIRYAGAGAHLGTARSKSLLVAQGDGAYAAVLDDDDCWLEDWLLRRVEFLETHPECVLVWAGHFDIDADGNRLTRSPFPFAGGVHSSESFVRTMMRANVVTTPSVLVRRDAYRRAGMTFDPAFVHIHDYEMWLRLGLLGPVGFLEVHDCCYRVHARQMSRRDDRAVDHLRLIDHLDALLRDSRPELRLPPDARRRQKADRMLSAALDAAEAGQRRIAARRIASAIRLAPPKLCSRRALGAIAATVGGDAIRRRISARPS